MSGSSRCQAFRIARLRPGFRVFGLPSELGDSLRLVLEEEPFEVASDDLLLVGSELGDGLELEPKLVVGSAFVLIEKKQICADA